MNRCAFWAPSAGGSKARTNRLVILNITLILSSPANKQNGVRYATFVDIITLINSCPDGPLIFHQLMGVVETPPLTRLLDHVATHGKRHSKERQK